MRLAFIITLLFAATICYGEDVTLIGRDLAPRRVNLQSLRNGVVTYFDADRAYHNEPLSRLLQLRFTPQHETAGGEGMVLELTDGQQFRGTWIGSSNDALRWRHDVLGEIVAPLDRVRAIRPANDPGAGDPPTSDHVTLNNGDVMSGFVVAVTDEGLSIQLDGQREAVTLPRDRIARVALANPAADAGDTHMVHLLDAGRVRATALTIEDARLHIEGATPGSVALSSVRRIDVAARGAKLVELADVAMTTTAGGDVFGMPMPPRVEAGVWRMHAPVTVRFDLPSGATRFGAMASLDADSAEPVQWADFTVRVTAGDATQACRITSDEPTCRINLPFDASATRLVIELDAGANGPVMDRLQLRDAVVLVERTD